MKSSLSRRRRRRRRRRDYAMRCSSEAWVGGMVWGGVVGGIGQQPTTTTTTHVSLRVFRAFPAACLLLLFSSILLLVYSYRVSQSLSLSPCLVSFLLSLSFFSAFLGKGIFSSTRGACCVDSRARVFPYAWSSYLRGWCGGGSTTRRLLRDDGEDDEDDGLAGEMTRTMNHCERSLRLSSTGNSYESWLWWSWNSRHTPVSPNSGSS